jgi:hypothetical protein
MLVMPVETGRVLRPNAAGPFRVSSIFFCFEESHPVCSDAVVSPVQLPGQCSKKEKKET